MSRLHRAGWCVYNQAAIIRGSRTMVQRGLKNDLSKAVQRAQVLSVTLPNRRRFNHFDMVGKGT